MGFVITLVAYRPANTFCIGHHWKLCLPCRSFSWSLRWHLWRAVRGISLEEIAHHCDIVVEGKMRKEELKSLVILSSFYQGVLRKGEVVPVSGAGGATG